MKLFDQITSTWGVAYGRCSSLATLPDFILNVLSFGHEYLSTWRRLGNLAELIKKRNLMFSPIFSKALLHINVGSLEVVVSSIFTVLESWSSCPLLTLFKCL